MTLPEAERAELRARLAISNYVASWNEDSVPFEWSATADEILERVALAGAGADIHLTGGIVAGRDLRIGGDHDRA